MDRVAQSRCHRLLFVSLCACPVYEADPQHNPKFRGAHEHSRQICGCRSDESGKSRSSRLGFFASVLNGIAEALIAVHEILLRELWALEGGALDGRDR